MNYVCRPGIVLTKICGQWLLIPTREASEHCPNVIHLSLPSVFVWRMIEKRKSREDIDKAIAILTHKDSGKVREITGSIIGRFIEKDLLIAAGEQS